MKHSMCKCLFSICFMLFVVNDGSTEQQLAFP